MAGRDFLEEQRRRQRELVAVRARRQNPDEAPPVETTEPAAPLTFSGKLKNFWFYYKYFLLAGVFLAAVLTVGITQCAGREKFDTEVVLFTYSSYIQPQIDAIECELEKYGVDTNGDGEVNIQIIDCSYGSNELMDQQQAKATKLTATIAANNNALIFITDEKSHKYLNDLFDCEFFVDIGLPDDNGVSLYLDEEFYSSVNSQNKDFPIPEGLKISRRVAGENTVIGQDKNTGEKIKNADELLKNMTK